MTQGKIRCGEAVAVGWAEEGGWSKTPGASSFLSAYPLVLPRWALRPRHWRARRAQRGRREPLSAGVGDVARHGSVKGARADAARALAECIPAKLRKGHRERLRLQFLSR